MSSIYGRHCNSYVKIIELNDESAETDQFMTRLKDCEIVIG